MALASETVALQIAANDLASAVIQRVNTNVNTLTTSTKNAGAGAVKMGEGLGKASNAITNLAGNMLGANNQVANLAEGLLSFGVGGPVVAGIAAGITVIAGALFYFNKQAREAKAGFDAFVKSLSPTSSLATVGAQVDAIKERIAAIDRNPNRNFDAIKRERAAAMQELATAEALYNVILTGNRVAAVRGGAKVAADRAKEAAKHRLDFNTIGWVPPEVIEGPERPLEVRGIPVADLPQPERISAITNALGPLNQALQQVGMSLGDVKMAFGETFTAAIASANNFADATIGAVSKAVKGTARTLGREQFAKAAAKFAEGLFPPNPLAIASALKHVAAGTLFMALAGGGGGGSVGAGGGGGGGRDFDRRTERLQNDQGTVTIQLPRDAVMHSGDPRWQEFLAETIRRLTGRRVSLEPA